MKKDLEYPSDWTIKNLGELGTFTKGKGISKSETTDVGIPCVRYGEIYTHHHYFIKEFNSFIDETVANSSVKIKKDDLLFAGSGETKEEIGKSVAYLFDKEAYAGGDIIILRPKNVNSLFLTYALNEGDLAKERARLGQGHSVVHIYAKDLKELKVPVPSESEQQKIASILSTWDKTIELKEKLIEQKKEQKKGLMEKLLTGKVRLPGFTGEWSEVRLDKIAKLSIGLVTTMTTNYVEDGVPLIRNSDILPNKIKSNLINLDHDFANKHKGRMLKKGDIVTVHTGEVGVSAVIGEDLDGSFGFATLNTRLKTKEFEPYFISYYFNSHKYKNFALRMSTGDGRNNFNLKDFKNSEVPSLPIEEQKAIVKVLSSFDKEIQLFEDQLNEYKKQKKGLMQLLLTGKVRVQV